jgi:hypothetical protein
MFFTFHLVQKFKNLIYFCYKKPLAFFRSKMTQTQQILLMQALGSTMKQMHLQLLICSHALSLPMKQQIHISILTWNRNRLDRQLTNVNIHD